MNDNLMTAISRSGDRGWLRQCRDHNAKLGHTDVVKHVDHRIRDLDLREAVNQRAEAGSVEERVFESLRVYRALLKHKHGRNQAAGYTERDIQQLGPLEALIRTIRKGKKTDGLKLLAEHDRLDCAYERIAIDHAAEMPADVVELAKRTLAEFEKTKGA